MKKKLFYASILVCVFLPRGLMAQQSKIDSLLALLPAAKEDSNKAIILNTLSWLYRNVDPARGIEYANKGLDLSININFKRGIRSSNNMLGVNYGKTGNYDKAIGHYVQSLQLSKQENDSSNISAALGNLASIFSKKGDYRKCIEYTLRSLEMDEKMNLKPGISYNLNYLGIIHYNINQYDQALEYYNRALKIREELGNKDDIAATLNNMGIIYDELRKDELAISYYLRSLEMRKESGNKLDISTSMNNLGSFYDDRGDFQKALEYYYETMAIKQELNDQRGIGLTYNNIGKLFLRKKDFISAEKNYSLALDVLQKIDSKDELIHSFLGLSGSAEGMNDFKKAYEYYKQYSAVKDSVFNEESSEQITEMQTKYETEKKEQQITLLNKDKELQDAQLNRQKIIIWSVAAGLLVVLTLSVFILRERRKSEKLLLNILPAETAKELKGKGRATARHYESVTVMFTDFKGFTNITEKLSAEELVSELDFLFKKFDEIISKYNIEKIKTIGDAYMCASGLPVPNSNHAEEIVKAGMEIQSWMMEQNGKWSLRMGIHSGPVTAGVVGDKKFAYDIWGDTVNTASRMESSGEPDKINISGSTYELLSKSPFFEGGKGDVSFVHRGKIPAKNKGEIDMYYVERSEIPIARG